jgi:hypothetical protein
MDNLKPGLYGQFYEHYVELGGDDPVALLYDQVDELSEFIETQKERLNYRYDADKWTIRQVVMHIIDAEHVFAYRFLRIGRGDKTPLVGFDLHPYIDYNDFLHLEEQDLIDLFVSRRLDTLGTINSMQTDYFERIGNASGADVDAGSLIYIMAGHVQHHINILKERYV